MDMEEDFTENDVADSIPLFDEILEKTSIDGLRRKHKALLEKRRQEELEDEQDEDEEPSASSESDSSHDSSTDSDDSD